MKSITLFVALFLMFTVTETRAQVGIGTPTPNTSAQLDVSSTNKGFLPPRMTEVQRNTIPNPLAGLMIWCNNCGVPGEIEVFNGTNWTNMVGGPPSTIPSVTIGNQVWMLKNLEVSRYRNGDIIPEVTDGATWASLTTGAWCYFNNDPANGAIYGKLYNWDAVTDSRGLAPIGWHVASDSEWTILETFLGGSNVAASAMKEAGTTHWLSPNTGTTNSSGFTALPGAIRDWNGGPFTHGFGVAGFWWTSTKDDITGFAYYRSMSYLSTDIHRDWTYHSPGCSVRCVRD